MPVSRRLAAEGLGTALLLAAIVGSGIMADRLASGNAGIALLCNSLATGAILYVLDHHLGPRVGRALQSCSHPCFFDAARDRRVLGVGVYRLPACRSAARDDPCARNVWIAAPGTFHHPTKRGQFVAGGGCCDVRIDLHDPRRDTLEAGSPLCGGRALYPFRLLVHLIDQLRQPRGNNREVPYRHFFRHRARGCCRVRSGSICRGDIGVAHLPLVDRPGFNQLRQKSDCAGTLIPIKRRSCRRCLGRPRASRSRRRTASR